MERGVGGEKEGGNDKKKKTFLKKKTVSIRNSKSMLLFLKEQKGCSLHSEIYDDSKK